MRTPLQCLGICRGEQNQADIPSRGLTASELVIEDKWWKGPEFLYNVEEEWLCEDNTHSEKENDMVSGEQVRQTGLHQIIDANRYSSLTKLLWVTA